MLESSVNIVSSFWVRFRFTDVKAARRRWVLLRVLPGHYGIGDNIFVMVLESFRYADIYTMKQLVGDLLLAVITEEDLFPAEGLWRELLLSME